MMDKIVIDFSFYRKLISFFFRLIAFDTREYKNQESTKLKKCVLIKNIIYLLLIANNCIFYLFTFVKLTRDLSDMKMLIVAINSIGSGTIAIIRNFKMFFNKSEIAELLKLLDKTTYTRSQEEKFKIVKYLNVFRRIVRYYSVNMITSTGLLFLTPAITLIISREKTFPLISPFSNDMDVGVMYPIALFYSFWTFATLLFGLYPAELIFAGALATLSVEFEILKDMLEDLPLKSDSEQIQLMKSFVDRHNELSASVATVEKIFSFPLFAFIVSSSFFICLCAFEATVMDFTDSIGMFYYCITSLLQVFIHCLCGQMLKNSCEHLTREVYNCKWEDVENIQVRMSLILMIERSQRPTMITIMKFADISMQRFTTASVKNSTNYDALDKFSISQVVAYSYSYFTLVRRLYDARV